MKIKRWKIFFQPARALRHHRGDSYASNKLQNHPECPLSFITNIKSSCLWVQNASPTCPLHSCSTAYIWVQAPLFPYLDELVLLRLLHFLQFLSLTTTRGYIKECKSDHVTTLLKTFQLLLLNWKRVQISYMACQASTSLSLFFYPIWYFSPWCPLYFCHTSFLSAAHSPLRFFVFAPLLSEQSSSDICIIYGAWAQVFHLREAFPNHPV